MYFRLEAVCCWYYFPILKFLAVFFFFFWEIFILMIFIKLFKMPLEILFWYRSCMLFPIFYFLQDKELTCSIIFLSSSFSDQNKKNYIAYWTPPAIMAWMQTDYLYLIILYKFFVFATIKYIQLWYSWKFCFLSATILDGFLATEFIAWRICWYPISQLQL